MNPILLNAMLLGATALGIGMVVPQILRLHRSASTEGVSIAWIGVGVAMNSWWTAYAVSSGLWGLLPVSVSGALLYLTMATQMVRLRGPQVLAGFATGALALGAVPLPALFLGGMQAAGIAVGLCYAVQFLPAVVESFRSADLRGLSMTTWIMALGEALIWAIYGTAVADAALVIGGIGGSVASFLIVAQLFRVRKPRMVFAA